ncbi:hypothetical protein APHAL10511_002422 [Amanita phalloides]|nr:hypothetical protein APHAL10511_002422 [Amanita phalloides]
MYQDLLEMERKLDWNMMRKKVKFKMHFQGVQTTTRTLRYISKPHCFRTTMADWVNVAPQANFETGEGIRVVIQVEGRLLELLANEVGTRTAAQVFNNDKAEW